MPSIKKRGNSYLIRVSNGYDADNNQIRYSMTWKPEPGWSEQRIEKELNKAAVLFEEECLHGGHAAPSNITFRELTELWFKERGKDHRGTTQYREHQISERVNEVLGNVKLSKLTRNDIQSFIISLGESGANRKSGQPLKQKTIKHHAAFISSVLGFAVEKELISDADNPYKRIVIPKKSSEGVSLKASKKKIYTEEEMKKLIGLLDDAPMKYRIFILLSIHTGCRRSEMISLKWNKINLSAGTILIDSSTNYTPENGVYEDETKTETSVRTVSLPEQLCTLLKAHKLEQDETAHRLGTKWEGNNSVFTQWNGKTMHPNTPYGWLKKLCEKNGLPFYGIHTFRHYYISYLIKDGNDIVRVAASAGHSTPQTTLSVYSHVIAESKAKEGAALSMPFDPPKTTATVKIKRSKPQARNKPCFVAKKKTRKPRK